MSEKVAPNTAKVGVGRTKLLILMGLYAAPLLAAWLWFGYAQKNAGAGVSVHGELIVPAVPLADFTLKDAQGADWQSDIFRKKWSMVYFAPAVCDTICEQNLLHMRKVRLRTGRRIDRVQRVLVTPAVEQMTEKLSQAAEGLRVIGGDSAAIDSLYSQVMRAQSGMDRCESCIYFVDPLGNLMMRFSADVGMKGMYEDLMHLLKVSRIG